MTPFSSLITRLDFGKSPALHLSACCHSPTPNPQPPVLSSNPPAILLHGYGGRKEDMLAIALVLQKEGINCVIPDLPGHGESDDIFSLRNVNCLIEGINEIASQGKMMVAGHSIGALIAMNTKGSHIVALSPPGEGFFEGGNKELLKILRARRVNEQSPYQGLQEVLAEFSSRKTKAHYLLLYSKNDIRSVNEQVRLLEDKYAFNGIQIRDANHLDIITSSSAIKSIGNYARQHFL